jgi:hypothetical protein
VDFIGWMDAVVNSEFAASVASSIAGAIPHAPAPSGYDAQREGSRDGEPPPQLRVEPKAELIGQIHARPAERLPLQDEHPHEDRVARHRQSE